MKEVLETGGRWASVQTDAIKPLHGPVPVTGAALSSASIKRGKTIPALISIGKMDGKKCEEMEAACHMCFGIRGPSWNLCSSLSCLTLGTFLNLSVP